MSRFDTLPGKNARRGEPSLGGRPASVRTAFGGITDNYLDPSGLVTTPAKPPPDLDTSGFRPLPVAGDLTNASTGQSWSQQLGPSHELPGPSTADLEMPESKGIAAQPTYHRGNLDAYDQPEPGGPEMAHAPVDMGEMAQAAAAASPEGAVASSEKEIGVGGEPHGKPEQSEEQKQDAFAAGWLRVHNQVLRGYLKPYAGQEVDGDFLKQMHDNATKAAEQAMGGKPEHAALMAAIAQQRANNDTTRAGTGQQRADIADREQKDKQATRSGRLALAREAFDDKKNQEGMSQTDKDFNNQLKAKEFELAKEKELTHIALVELQERGADARTARAQADEIVRAAKPQLADPNSFTDEWRLTAFVKDHLPFGAGSATEAIRSGAAQDVAGAGGLKRTPLPMPSDVGPLEGARRGISGIQAPTPPGRGPLGAPPSGPPMPPPAGPAAAASAPPPSGTLPPPTSPPPGGPLQGLQPLPNSFAPPGGQQVIPTQRAPGGPPPTAQSSSPGVSTATAALLQRARDPNHPGHNKAVQWLSGRGLWPETTTPTR